MSLDASGVRAQPVQSSSRDLRISGQLVRFWAPYIVFLLCWLAFSAFALAGPMLSASAWKILEYIGLLATALGLISVVLDVRQLSLEPVVAQRTRAAVALESIQWRCELTMLRCELRRQRLQHAASTGA